MNTNFDGRVDDVLGTLATAHWDRPADAAGAGELRRRALARRPMTKRRAAGLALLSAAALTGLGFAAAAILHSFPLSMEIESEGATIYSGDMNIEVKDGVIAPVTVQTDHGPLTIPIDLPPGIKPEQVVGMKMKVAVKYSEEVKSSSDQKSDEPPK